MESAANDRNAAPRRAMGLSEDVSRPADRALDRTDLHEPRLCEKSFDLLDGAQRIHRRGQLGEQLLRAGSIAQEQAPAWPKYPADLAEVGQRLVPEIDDVDGEGGVEASIRVRDLRTR